jgi:hypothetical protein
MSNAFPQPSLGSEPSLFSFNDLGSRQVIAVFSAGYLSSDGGMLFLRQMDLEADRTSSHWMASNQLRLWLSTFALLLFQRLRTLALQGTELANATAGTIRQRLLKIGALVRVSTRRVYVRLASAFPLQNLFAQVHRALVGLVAEDG